MSEIVISQNLLPYKGPSRFSTSETKNKEKNKMHLDKKY